MARHDVLDPPAQTIDPRMRERRADVRRAAGRRWLRRAGWAALVASVPALLFAVTRSPALDVDRIEVGGARRTDVLELVGTSGIGLGDPMTDLDLGTAAVRVARLPWVDDVVVDRDWPSTVRIVVTERTPVAALAAGEGRWSLVDERSRVLAVVDDPGDLPVLVGLGELPAPGEALEPEDADVVAVAAALPSSLEEVVTEVAVVDGAVHLTSRDGGDVLLGGADELEAKLGALATMVAKVDLTCLQVLDLRVPSAPVLTRDPDCG